MKLNPSFFLHGRTSSVWKQSFSIYLQTMVGYPYYNNAGQDKVYFFDTVVKHKKVFVSGFLIGIGTSPSIAFADDGTPGAPVPAPEYPSTAANLTRLAISGAACTATAKCGEMAINKMSDKALASTPPNVAVGVACVFVAGWCVGQFVDRVVKNNL